MPYIICVEKDNEGNLSANQKGLAERAHHPEEINAASSLAIDAEYYLTQQVCTSQQRHSSHANHTSCAPSFAKPTFMCMLPALTIKHYLTLELHPVLLG